MSLLHTASLRCHTCFCASACAFVTLMLSGAGLQTCPGVQHSKLLCLGADTDRDSVLLLSCKIHLLISALLSLQGCYRR